MYVVPVYGQLPEVRKRKSNAESWDLSKINSRVLS